MLAAELSTLATGSEDGAGACGLGDFEARASATERRRAAVLVTLVSNYRRARRSVRRWTRIALIALLRETAVDVVRGYGGLVNQAMGDEIVSLFGVPSAHEDDDLRGFGRPSTSTRGPSARPDATSGVACASSPACTWEPVVARRLHEGPRRYDSSARHRRKLSPAALADPRRLWSARRCSVSSGRTCTRLPGRRRARFAGGAVTPSASSARPASRRGWKPRSRRD